MYDRGYGGFLVLARSYGSIRRVAWFGRLRGDRGSFDSFSSAVADEKLAQDDSGFAASLGVVAGRSGFLAALGMTRLELGLNAVESGLNAVESNAWSESSGVELS